MADEQVKIDKDVFHDRLSGFIAGWKNDRRAGDATFNGAASLAIVMGKADEGAGYQKNSAFHVGHNRGNDVNKS
jgi:nucleosome binding factor SPN SPT16 subunit